MERKGEVLPEKMKETTEQQHATTLHNPKQPPEAPTHLIWQPEAQRSPGH